MPFRILVGWTGICGRKNEPRSESWLNLLTSGNLHISKIPISVSIYRYEYQRQDYNIGINAWVCILCVYIYNLETMFWFLISTSYTMCQGLNMTWLKIFDLQNGWLKAQTGPYLSSFWYPTFWFSSPSDDLKIKNDRNKEKESKCKHWKNNKEKLTLMTPIITRI